ncbi:MAG: hypothetical protein M9915_14255 [Rhizobacter sp.]|nr:hypothetical protein [Rhizobacter sp.]
MQLAPTENMRVRCHPKGCTMSHFANRLIAASFVAVTALVAAGSVQAVVYRGTWDPAYGPALPDLGWRGEAFFDIPATCLAKANALYWNLPGACSPQTILSGKVELYDLNDSGTTLQTLSFDESNNIDTTIAMRVKDHKLAGVVGWFNLPEESCL